MTASLKKPIFFTILIGGIAFLILYKIFSKDEEKKGPAAGPMAQKVAVRVFPVNQQAFSNKIVATGSVQPDEQVEIISEISGKITNINFEEGKRVLKGQVLATINAAELRAGLAKLQSNLKLYKQMEARQRQLLEKEYISQQEYDQAINQLRTSEADIQAQQALLAKATLRAPFTGVIGLRNVSEGAFVGPNTQIATLVSTQPVKIDFSIPSRYSAAVHVGDSVRFSIEGTPESYKAIIYALEPQIDPNTRTQQVRARYHNKNQNVLPGSFVRVEVPLKEMPDAILIPTEAVMPELNGHKVFVVQNGKAQAKQVKIGFRSDRLIQITEGLQPGDSVISSGILQVKPGADVVVQGVDSVKSN
ncbi:MAG: efflux RND transporter periplasmic adaptor subunit [Hymenobacteraceae bacterium]|nr:efflux RND transporter periplasmic adaptor subunit [Hymenobacteraceae bacterium]